MPQKCRFSTQIDTFGDGLIGGYVRQIIRKAEVKKNLGVRIVALLHLTTRESVGATQSNEPLDHLKFYLPTFLQKSEN